MTKTRIKTYQGRPIAQMSRDDLIDALTDACKQNARLAGNLEEARSRAKPGGVRGKAEELAEMVRGAGKKTGRWPF